MDGRNPFRTTSKPLLKPLFVGTVDGQNPAPPKKPWATFFLGIYRESSKARSYMVPEWISQPSTRKSSFQSNHPQSNLPSQENTQLRGQVCLKIVKVKCVGYAFIWLIILACFPLLVFKGIYHYWKYAYSFEGT